jgi:hypothetical protein
MLFDGAIEEEIHDDGSGDEAVGERGGHTREWVSLGCRENHIAGVAQPVLRSAIVNRYIVLDTVSSEAYSRSQHER